MSMMELGRNAMGLTKQLSRLRKEEIEIAADEKLTWKEKLVKRKGLEKERAEIANEFNKDYIAEKKRLAMTPVSKRQPEAVN